LKELKLDHTRALQKLDIIYQVHNDIEKNCVYNEYKKVKALEEHFDPEQMTDEL
jgi:hypothetical protein